MLAHLLVPSLCWGCGGPARRVEPLCLDCRRTLRHLGPEQVGLAGVATWAPLAYEGAARELVRGLKFRGAMALADQMAALIVANAPEELLPRGGAAAARADAAAAGRDRPGANAAAGSGPDWRSPVLVPVPLHASRRRRRGFNQAAVLAEALGRRTGLGVVEGLARAGPAGTQVGRARSERLAAPPGRILARGRPPARAIVVDDVATTGATLSACAAALRAAGALEVRALSFARTLGR